MRLIFIVIVMLLTTPAWAAITGVELNGACSSTGGSVSDKLCQAYINGVVDGVLGDQYERDQRTPICLPERIDTAEVRVRVMQFFVNNPQALPFLAGSSVAEALRQAYPCKPN